MIPVQLIDSESKEHIRTELLAAIPRVGEMIFIVGKSESSFDCYKVETVVHLKFKDTPSQTTIQSAAALAVKPIDVTDNQPGIYVGDLFSRLASKRREQHA
jgi:hypothetical protein